MEGARSIGSSSGSMSEVMLSEHLSGYTQTLRQVCKKKEYKNRNMSRLLLSCQEGSVAESLVALSFADPSQLPIQVATVKMLPKHGGGGARASMNDLRAAEDEHATLKRKMAREKAKIHGCTYCGARDRDLQVCKGCHAASYCDRTCQRRHWKQGHKRECMSQR